MNRAIQNSKLRWPRPTRRHTSTLFFLVQRLTTYMWHPVILTLFVSLVCEKAAAVVPKCKFNRLTLTLVTAIFVILLEVSGQVSATCPPGKYTNTIGSASAQPQCEPCPAGFFKALTSSSSTDRDSCIAHTKCPPGKYTTVAGSVTAQPQRESCTVGFFKSMSSQSSTCVGSASTPQRGKGVS